MKKSNSLHKSILNITFIALFAALCYISLMIFFFPLGNMYIHFGNLIVVVASLLIGGWQGGLSGSIGMGLFDIFNGHADSSPKTFLLKFLIGLTVGVIFVYLKKMGVNKTVSAVIGAILGMIVNLTGEVLWKTVQFTLAGSTFNAAFVSSVASQSSTLVNAAIAVVGGVALFSALEKPVKKIIK